MFPTEQPTRRLRRYARMECTASDGTNIGIIEWFIDSRTGMTKRKAKKILTGDAFRNRYKWGEFHFTFRKFKA